jgi:hypothetical protein
MSNATSFHTTGACLVLRSTHRGDVSRRRSPLSRLTAGDAGLCKERLARRLFKFQ